MTSGSPSTPAPRSSAATATARLPRIAPSCDRRRRRRSRRRRARRRSRRRRTSRPTVAFSLRTSPGARDRIHAGYPTRRVTSDRRPLRGAVLGLGMIGRHHARLLQASERVAFAGAVDPAGDVHGAVRDAGLVFAIDRRAARPPERPTSRSSPCRPKTTSRPCASSSPRGVSVLVEKPLAASDRRRRREIVELCAAAGVHGAVGHVERFNPALLELRRRVQDGPARRRLPDRDRARRPVPRPRARRRRRQGPRDARPRPRALARRLARRSALAAQTQHKMGREHEDLVLVTGRLESGVSFNSRRRLALADQGPAHADPRRARDARRRHADRGPDLLRQRRRRARGGRTSQALRGVSEGDMTRYALSRREPLLGPARGVRRPRRRWPGRAASSRSRRASGPSPRRRGGPGQRRDAARP